MRIETNIVTVFIAIITSKTKCKINACIGFVLVDHVYQELVQHQKQNEMFKKQFSIRFLVLVLVLILVLVDNLKKNQIKCSVFM